MTDDQRTPEYKFDEITDALARPRNTPHEATHLSELLVKVARLHRPRGRTYEGRVCEGCGPTAESDNPDWPCQTILLLGKEMNRL